MTAISDRCVNVQIRSHIAISRHGRFDDGAQHGAVASVRRLQGGSYKPPSLFLCLTAR